MDFGIKRKLYEFIQARPQAVIATASRKGKPEAALIDIAVTSDLEIIFETTSATRKFANLESNPVVSFVIGWQGDETLQYDGIVDEPSGPTLERIRNQYLSRFPEKLSHQYWPGNGYFRARPSWIRFSSYYAPRKIREYQFPLYDGAVAPSWWHRLLGNENLQHN